jgi:hypothetical protein
LDLLLSVLSKGSTFAEGTNSVGLQLSLDWACNEAAEMDAAVRVKCLKV